MKQNHDPKLYQTLLENLSDGVIVIGSDGYVQIANSAFCQMFGFEPDEVEGSLFGELFIMFEGFDEFAEIILNAVTDRHSGERQVTSVRIREELRLLSVTTSYLATTHPEEAERTAVVAVISDITEIQELRETELRMAKVTEKQRDELQVAYRDLESRNAELSQIGKRIQTTRNVATIFVLTLFLAVGIWYLKPLDLSGPDVFSEPSGDLLADDPGAMQTMVVEARDFDSTITLRGHLVPGRIVEIVSPIESHVSTVHAVPGQRVTEGDLLVGLDASQLAAEYKQTQVDYIKARDRLAQVEDWANSAEMARVRRALRRARMGLDDSQQNLKRTAFLLEQGIVPASEHEGAQRQLQNRQLDFAEAEQELEAVRMQGGAEEQRVAKLEAENVESRLRAHEEKLAQTEILAPISGAVMPADDGPGAKPLVRGRSVAQGELLLSIADFERLSVVTRIDEVDVRKIRIGQKARITGPGFPGLQAEGSVTFVSSQAGRGSRMRNTPQFEITVALDRLEAEALSRLRVGMSAHVTIVVYNQPQALLIPLHAVVKSADGARVHVIDPKTQAIEQRTVTLGLTTLDSVEVMEGLVAGETIVLFVSSPETHHPGVIPMHGGLLP